ncbi:hypothetical protein pb186bvf_020389 [Paramecium bursaria]
MQKMAIILELLKMNGKLMRNNQVKRNQPIYILKLQQYKIVTLLKQVF